MDSDIYVPDGASYDGGINHGASKQTDEAGRCPSRNAAACCALSSVICAEVERAVFDAVPEPPQTPPKAA
jgi:hypothetical protein